MITLSPLLLLVLAELLLLFGAAATVLGVTIVVRRGKERRAVNKLISRIKEDENRRRDETQELLAKKFGFEGEALKSLANTIAREEKRLYQSLINLFLKRDLNRLEVLHVECEGVTEPYRTMELPQPAAGDGAETGDAVVSDLSVELEMLREENERLTTELGVTMDTMGKMLNEYASMYGGGAGKSLDKTKILETFQSGSDEPSPAEDPDAAAGLDTQPESFEVPDDVEEFDIDIGGDDETALIDLQEPAASADDPGAVAVPAGVVDETLVFETGENEFEELEEMDDETALIDLSEDDRSAAGKPG